MSVNRARCPLCNQLSPVFDGPFVCRNDSCAEDAAALAAEAARPLTDAEIMAVRYEQLGDAILNDPRTNGWVYYLRFGHRVKIGTTRDLKRRLRSIPHDEVLAIEPGSQIVERERHTQFARSRVNGQREWFHWNIDLLAHCSELVKTHGTPAEILGGA